MRKLEPISGMVSEEEHIAMNQLHQLEVLLQAYQNGDPSTRARAGECLLLSINNDSHRAAEYYARRLYNRYGCKEVSHGTFELDDLIQEAIIAALHAYDCFDISKTKEKDPERALLSFVRYVHIHQDGAIKTFIGASCGVSDHYVKQLLRIKKAGLSLWHSDDEALKEALASGAHGSKIKDLQGTLDKLRHIFIDRGYKTLSIDENDESWTDEIEIGASLKSMEAEMSKIEWRYIIEVLVAEKTHKSFKKDHGLTAKEFTTLQGKVTRKLEALYEGSSLARLISPTEVRSRVDHRAAMDLTSCII